MKIVFFGTPEIAVTSLQRIIDSERHPVVGVVTQPDRPAGRGRKLTASPVKGCAIEHNLPLLQPVKLADEAFIAELNEWGADCFAIIAYRILPWKVWSLPARGTINVHPSLLPEYRGAAPIRWALFDGRDETGVTTFLIQKEIDAGQVLLTRRVSIGPEETYGELATRLAEVGADLLLETLDKWERKEITPQPQDSTKLNKAPKITAEDRIIDWQQSARQTFNRVRALAPNPGALCRFRGKQAKILQTRLTDAERGASHVPVGTTIVADPKMGITVAAGTDALALTVIQPAGKRPMTGAEFVRGYRVSPGELWS